MSREIFLNVSLIKTIYLNLKYFGIRGVLRPSIFVSRNVKLKKTEGKIILHKQKIGCVKIGFGKNDLFDSKKERMFFVNTGEIEFFGSASISFGSKIINSGNLVFGDKFSCNSCTKIVCLDKIVFGENCTISWECLIMDGDYHKVYSIQDREMKTQLNQNAAVILGDHCWIGARCVLLKNTRLMDYTIVGAQSVVCRAYTTSNCVVVTAGVIKKNILWK